MNTISKISILLQNCKDYELINHPKPIVSVEDALGVFDIDRTAPTFILSDGSGKYYSLILSGKRKRIDFASIDSTLNRKTLHLAKKDNIFDITGFQMGNIPFIGLKLPCIFDAWLFNYSHVYGGIGNPNYTVKINPHELYSLNNVIATID